MKGKMYVLGILFLVIACTNNKEAMRSAIDEEFQRQLKNFEIMKNAQCRQAALTEAEHYVDSLILSLKIKPMRDSIYNPEIPLKPEYVPVDSVVFKKRNSGIPGY